MFASKLSNSKVTSEHLRQRGRKKKRLSLLFSLCVLLAGTGQRLRSAVIGQTSPVKRYLIVNPVSGLGNRMRATCSAAVLAERMGRELIVVWLPDVHLQANMSDLFDTGGMKVFDHEIYEQLPPDDTTFYNFDATGQVPIRRSDISYIYVKTAFRLNGHERSLRVPDILFDRCIRKLRPNYVVEDLHSHMKSMIRLHPKTAGIHIRMLGTLVLDVPDLSKAASNERHIEPEMQNIVAYERSKCNVSFFKKPMKLLNDSWNVHFFVSMDSAEAWESLSQTSTEFHMSLLNPVSYAKCLTSMRRSAFCAQHALAEMLALSEMDYFLYSSWSSFSEMIISLRKSEKESSILGCATDSIMLADIYARVLKKTLV